MPDRYWNLFLWTLGLSEVAGVSGGGLTMVLYGAAGGLMWIRCLEFVLVQEMLGQVLLHLQCLDHTARVSSQLQ